MILKEMCGRSGKRIEVFVQFQSLLARRCIFFFHGKQGVWKSLLYRAGVAERRQLISIALSLEASAAC